LRAGLAAMAAFLLFDSRSFASETSNSADRRQARSLLAEAATVIDLVAAHRVRQGYGDAMRREADEKLAILQASEAPGLKPIVVSGREAIARGDPGKLRTLVAALSRQP
jgi:hypothetical protein